MLPPWTVHVPQHIDDTQFNALCWSCHTGSGSPGATFVRTHSSLQTDSGYGDWTIECRTCHDPHTQLQIRTYGSDSYLYSGVSTSVTSTTLTQTGAGWTDDEYQDLVLIPDVDRTSRLTYGYKITGNTSDTITVEGPIDLSRVTAGVDTFAIIYGKLVQSTIVLDEIIDPLVPKTGSSTVRFFNTSGTNSFADGNLTFDGVCEVCHTETAYHKNDGSGSSHSGGLDCRRCHNHLYGFAHGGGGDSSDCEECHGHDPGYGGFTGGRGSYVSHSTHTENDADDLRGPNVGCDTCHDTSGVPYFNSGTDSNEDGRISLDETDVCDACHSPGGTYDGVNDAVVGAKNNWSAVGGSTSPVYTAEGTLHTGKDKWCAGCHDESPSQIQSIDAPNIIGDEDGSYTYGTGWGYYKTGHGLPSGQLYPSSGGLVPGAGKACDNCHDFTLSHIDGMARTFDCSDGCDSTEYRQSYRLKLVNGLNPLRMPRGWGSTPVIADDFRLCLQVGCHNSDEYIKSGMLTTNFRDETDGDYPSGAVTPSNQHAFHLGLSGLGKFYADWGNTAYSHPTCIACHNVHGTTQLSMVRDGKLVNKEPGMVMYYNNGVESLGPSSTTLADSEATAFIPSSTWNLCASCHAAGGYYKYDRTPPGTQQSPTLSWTGEANYITDGTHPDSAAGGSYFVFRVDYTDANGEPPQYIQVWIDENDNGTYESGEKYDMAVVDPSDLDYTDGKRYQKTLAIRKTADGSLNYRFYATDGKDTAGGFPASDSTVNITNNAPLLAWTGESAYTDDGVDPDSGAGGSSFAFRVSYTDSDNDAPSSMQVWIDENDNTSYEVGEQYSMTEIDAGDTDYTDGKLYIITRSVSYAGDGNLAYRFYASDGADNATGDPVSNNTVSVTSSNTAPTLSWTGDTGYSSDGVNPDSGAGCIDFEFRVIYSDSENNAPSSIQVWIDENDNSSYEAGEMYDITETDSSDNEYWNGKVYSGTFSIAYAGDGDMNYRFYASDGTAEAAGPPVADSTLTVADALEVPAEYSTIQAAIDAAVNGDYVCVSDGTYDENIDYSGKAITVKSVSGPELTIIEGSGTNAPVVQFNSGEGTSSVIDGFTIDNQLDSASATRGIVIVDSSPVIRNCRIQGNHVFDGGGRAGGGIYVNGGGATIEDCIIGGSYDNRNSANGYGLGAGIYFVNSTTGTLSIIDSTISYNQCMSGAGIYLDNISSTTVISNTTISNNTTSGGRDGGGIWSRNAPLSITDSTIENNLANWSGGGLLLAGDSTSATIKNSTFSGNTGGYYGGGIYASTTNGSLSISNSSVSGNICGGKQAGGGIYMTGTSYSATITNTTVNSNNAGYWGGAFHISGDSPTVTITGSIIDGNTAGYSSGGMNFQPSNNGSLSIIDSRVTNNTSGGASGGGFILTGGTGTLTVDMERTLIAGNYSGSGDGSGGGISAGGNILLSLSNCTITGNKSNSSYGGGLSIGSGVTAGIIHCTISGNTAGIGGGMNMGSGSTVTITNSIIWNNEHTSNAGPEIYNGGGDLTVTYTDIRENGFEGNGNIWAYPMFVDSVDWALSPTADGDYHIQQDSPVIDMGFGNGVLMNDIDDDTRPQKSGYDMGSDEALNITSLNNIPALLWTGETNYTADGVDPDSGADGSNFEFRVLYLDADNESPGSIQVWVDENDNDSYEGFEFYDMNEADAGDTDFSDGKIYTLTLPLAYVGDGNIDYRFYASDGTDDAIGTSTADNIVIIAP